MNKFYGPILLLAFCLSVVCCDAVYGAENNDANTPSDNDGGNYDKRVERYAFGLGKRASPYTRSNGKRLPNYNFGLGKRARPYSFGLGKRAEYDDDLGQLDLDELITYMDEKRNRPYSFGLGKRDAPEDVERRSIQRYGFGLGR